MGLAVLFKGHSTNDVIRNRVDDDARLLEARGHEVLVIDLTVPAQLSAPKTVDLFVGYQCWGQEIMAGPGRRFIDLYDCPYVAPLGDHPVHHSDRVTAASKNTTFLVSSRSQAGYIRDDLPAKADAAPYTSTISPDAARSERVRDIDALVVAQAQPPEAFLAANKLPAALDAIILEVLEHAASEPRLDPVVLYMREGYERVLKATGKPAAAAGLGRLVDLARRHTFRWNMAQALRKLPVTFVGDDWVALPREPDDRFSALPSVPHSQLPDLYCRAKLALNLFPPYYDWHERIVETLIQGAAIATPETPWMAECFDFGREALALPIDAREAADWLSATLADPDALAASGVAGRDRVIADFNDATRIDIYERIMAGHRTGNAPMPRTAAG